MIEIDGEHLTLEKIVEVCRQREKIRISSHSYQKIKQSHENLLNLVNRDIPLYGINTGFGIFANEKIPIEQNLKLNKNLILSHAVRIGNPLLEEAVRATMCIRINSFAKGLSGIQIEVVETLVNMLNEGVTPLVLDQGSLGSSGDLNLLAQMALVISKDSEDREDQSGQAYFHGQLMSGKQAMRSAGIERVELQHKDGLALINGATFSAALGSLAVMDAQLCLKIANTVCALSAEANLARRAAFHPQYHAARNLPGQILVAKDIHELLSGSTLTDSHPHVQDPYSIRCAPQVHGAILDTIEFVKNTVEKEINAATDNPLIIGDEVISGGNFHGEPLAFGMDFLGIALTELSAISERRTYLLLDSKLNNGLPEMLISPGSEPGLNSGVMIPQYTAASLVLENRTLAAPDSVQSLPTSGGQEDHNANAMNAARHTIQIVRNTLKVLAIEIFTAVRAIHLRLMLNPEKKLGNETEKIYAKITDIAPFREEDNLWSEDIEKISQLIKNNEI